MLASLGTLCPRPALSVRKMRQRRSVMRKFIGGILLASGLLLGACNTVEGVGKDVKSAGDTVAKTADGAK